jgi:hypothetical protein
MGVTWRTPENTPDASMAGWVVLVEVVEVVGVVEVVDDGVVDDGGVDDGVIGLAVSHEASRTAATAANRAKRFTIDPFIAEDRDSSVPVALVATDHWSVNR